jgi:hypothetical protein
MIRFLGWIYLAFAAGIGLIAVYTVLKSAAVAALYWVVLGIYVSILASLGAACLATGNRLERNNTRARPAGILLSLLSLINIPIGTVLGLMALVNIVKGRNEYS